MQSEERIAAILADWLESREDGSAPDLEGLVRRHPELEDGLRRGFAALALMDFALEKGHPDALDVPEALGPYRILEVVGDGGMGTVYRAVAEQGSRLISEGTTVAVKCVHPHLLKTPGFNERFAREAELGQRIRHPNVVRTYGLGEDDAADLPDHLLVMEYVEGQTLESLGDELGSVPEELCRHVGLQIARGLQAVHEAGAVHRDLKPANVLITLDHRVKIMDLGVAWLAEAQVRLSQTGVFLGSLLYASPEQFGSRTVDGRSDLYALGLILYELAAGTHPFRADDSAQVIRQQLERTPRPIGEINPQISPFLERVVTVLLSKSPDKRVASAAELVRILEEGDTGEWWRRQARLLCQRTKRPLRRIRIPRETDIYGRAKELEWLAEAYRRIHDGQGQVLLIEGEAGIGKTRLVDEFIGRLRQDGEDPAFLFGSYPPGGAATSAGAFSTAYREHFGAASLEEALPIHLRALPSLVPAFAALLRGESSPAEALPLTRESLQTAFTSVSKSLASESPVVVLIDDLHFAPDEGRGLFAALAMAVPDQRILLIGTTRPGLPSDWVASLQGLPQTSHRTLPRIGPKDLVSLLEDAFRSQQLAEELGVLIARKADGNPFFAFEIIRGLREGQLIAQRPDGSWATTGVIQDIAVPDSVRDLVNARIADLEAVERDILDVASCCGFEFDPLLVGEALGVARLPALKHLARMERRHRLVRAAGSTYLFDHHQVQEAVYASLSNPLREEYHLVLAEALVVRHAPARRPDEDPPGAHCVDVCAHFLRSGRPEGARPYLDSALEHLASQHRNDQALALADRALKEADLLPRSERLDVLLWKNEVLGLLGRRVEQENLLAEARELATTLDDTSRLTKVEAATGQMLHALGRNEEACERYERCLAAIRQQGDRAAEARVESMLGTALWYLDRDDEGYEALRRALALSREVGDVSCEAAVSINLGMLLRKLNRQRDGLAMMEDGLRLAIRSGSRRWEANATGNLGQFLDAVGRHAEALEKKQRWLELAREIGDRQAEARARTNLGASYRQLAQYEACRAQWDEALAISREIGDRHCEAIAQLGWGLLLADLGDLESAEAHFEENRTIARQVGDRARESGAVGLLAWIAAERHEHERAASLFDEALARNRELGVLESLAFSLVALGELRVSEGRQDEARSCLEELVADKYREAAPADFVVAHCLLTRLADPDDDTDAATAVAAFEGCRDQLRQGDRLRVHYHLWRAYRDAAHLVEAKRLLDYRVEHAPEEYRESMLKNVRLNREIMKAWAEHGELALSEWSESKGEAAGEGEAD